VRAGGQLEPLGTYGGGQSFSEEGKVCRVELAQAAD
jgi:hypothetical protein